MLNLIQGFLQVLWIWRKKTGAKWRTHIDPNEVDGAMNKNGILLAREIMVASLEIDET